MQHICELFGLHQTKRIFHLWCGFVSLYKWVVITTLLSHYQDINWDKVDIDHRSKSSQECSLRKSLCMAHHLIVAFVTFPELFCRDSRKVNWNGDNNTMCHIIQQPSTRQGDNNQGLLIILRQPKLKINPCLSSPCSHPICLCIGIELFIVINLVNNVPCFEHLRAGLDRCAGA